MGEGRAALAAARTLDGASITPRVRLSQMPRAGWLRLGGSESFHDGPATGRDCGPPLLRRARAGAGRRPADVSDKWESVSARAETL